MDSPALFHIAFYRFVRMAEPARAAAALRELAHGLTGAVLVATEGISGTLAGGANALDAFQAALGADARFEGAFAGLAFTRTRCEVAPFGRLKVHVRAQILPLGVDGVDACGRRGRQLTPGEWRAMLDAGDAVVIDNRNGFEHRLGHFTGALDPQVGNFRDLPAFVEAHAAEWKAQGRPVAMYCTGGIRCEKTAAWMQDAFDIEVLQLEGGILRYLSEVPDARRDWQGACFVFDNRLALDADLRQADVTPEQVYAGDADEAWRLQRARRLSKVGAIGPVDDIKARDAGNPGDRID